MVHVVAATRDIVIAIGALRHDSPVAISKWISAGGTINREVIAYKSLRLRLRPEQWYCLGYLVDLIDAGAEIDWSSDDSVSIRVPDGVHFQLSAVQFASTVCTVAERFASGEYSELSVEGNVVIDIGANIGDSAIYFARRGAIRVYAYEPFPSTCEVALRNVTNNGVAPQVEITAAGVGNKHETLVADFDEGISPFLSLHGKPHPKASRSRRARQTIRVVPFVEVLRRVRSAHIGVPIVCKIDCEGSEFEILDETLTVADVKAVKQILVEYHRRPAPIVRVLKALGFDIRIQNGASTIGLLMATRP